MRPVPKPTPTTSLRALQAIISERSVLAGMQVFHRETGDIFRLSLPGFNAVSLAGPEACHFVLVKGKDDLRWRMDGDPITNLLIHGVLVEDGDSHDQIRRNLNPALHKQMMEGYSQSFVRRTEQVTAMWRDDQPVDMLVEMRKVALLILMDSLFNIDYTPEMERLWSSVLNLIGYISPGIWMVWKDAPRPGYQEARAQMDEYLFRIIRLRREEGANGTDMLSVLIQSRMSDELIRDQLMTMLIAGHDTSTAMLSWALHMLSLYPEAAHKAQREIDTVLGDAEPTVTNTLNLKYLDQIIDETLRLFPPIHLGSRIAAVDLDFNGYHIPAGTRVLYSIFLTQRHPDYWQHPNDFIPERFDQKPAPHTYLPFGGGKRNCIGMTFAQSETRVVLAKILQDFDLHKRGGDVHLHMAATLEPRPGVWIQPKRR
jgi:cytochrome P450